jgi:hypothetical protein
VTGRKRERALVASDGEVKALYGHVCTRQRDEAL